MFGELQMSPRHPQAAKGRPQVVESSSTSSRWGWGKQRHHQGSIAGRRVVECVGFPGRSPFFLAGQMQQRFVT
jgi:hypothetical protein